MVNINLYKNKKQKFKITTILFLIAILLLPVLGYRVTLMTLKNNEMQKIRATNPQSGIVLRATPISDYEGSIRLLNAKDEETKTQISILQSERRNLERSLVYAMITRKFFQAIDESYQKFSREERVFIDSILIERKSKGRQRPISVLQRRPEEYRSDHRKHAESVATDGIHGAFRLKNKNNR